MHGAGSPVAPTTRASMLDQRLAFLEARVAQLEARESLRQNSQPGSLSCTEKLLTDIAARLGVPVSATSTASAGEGAALHMRVSPGGERQPLAQPEIVAPYSPRYRF